MKTIVARDPKRKLVLVADDKGKLSWHFAWSKWQKTEGYDEAPPVTVLFLNALAQDFTMIRPQHAMRVTPRRGATL